MIYRLLFTFAFTLLCIDLLGQSGDSVGHLGIRRVEERLSLLIAYNGIEKHFGEIGIARNRLDGVGYHMLGWTYFISTEVMFHNNLVVGPKLGGWVGGGVSAFALGLNAIVYTDFEETSWRLRPELGCGLDFFKIVYGYNYAITNKDFEGINNHNFSLVFLLRLRAIKSVEK